MYDMANSNRKKARKLQAVKKAKAAENPSTVRISGGSENEKKQSKMCLTTDLTTYTTTI